MKSPGITKITRMSSSGELNASRSLNSNSTDCTETLFRCFWTSVGPRGNTDQNIQLGRDLSQILIGIQSEQPIALNGVTSTTGQAAPSNDHGQALRE